MKKKKIKKFSVFLFCFLFFKYSLAFDDSDIFVESVFFTAISIISAFNTQKVWKGNLQIVLSKEDSNYGSNNSFSNLITGLSGQGNTNSDVNTQVEISTLLKMI